MCGGTKVEAPKPDPNYYAALNRQLSQADDLISFVKSSYADGQTRLAKQDALNDTVIGQQMTIAQKAADRADDAYKFYQTTGRPAVERSINEAQNWDSEANLGKARGEAIASVQQQFDAAEGQQMRTLSRMGINPNSGRMLALNSQMAAARALGQASAANNASDTRKAQGAGMRTQAANLGMGMPGQSMGWGQQSGGMGSSAAGIGASGLASGMALNGQAMGGMQAAGSQLGSVASGYQGMYGTQANIYGQQMQARGQELGGIGQLVGLGASVMGLADGGKVVGPGTGTSDSVPAMNKDTGQQIMLSNGEFVIPADVVRKKGSEFFQKMIDKHHTPVNKPRNLGGAA